MSPNPGKARILFDKLWKQVLDESPSPSACEDIVTLVNSSYVSIRYCLPTQLLGKLTDHSLDALCLQKGEGSDSRLWDPRSFYTKTIGPWVSDNQSVLGTSPDPYVSQPVRALPLGE
ncbi:MAG: restriction endonuclease, SacI family [Deltaproteobacteria bacterium]|nr:restriction endonuclease, SacI family [Deltaproteobacteria bacterium]MBW2085323.1 restriction endonuclease, SacI family [Deltaproteobacteria bacterium]